MTISELEFERTWLWQQAFKKKRSDCSSDEQQFFRSQLLSIRKRAAQLVSRISADLPEMTVHDISHLDALWETASIVAEEAVYLNPAEAFVFGSSILLHDAGMSLAAFPGGITEIKNTLSWKDSVAHFVLSEEESGADPIDSDNLPESIVQKILPEVLRKLHANHAEVLAEQAWRSSDGENLYLIEDSDLRNFYGPTIGKIAHSHWWSVHKVENELSEDLGALADRTHFRIDRVKLACLLRIADALHLDSRRAPRFLRAITNPRGTSSLHWSFQERLARPHIDQNTVVFTTGQPFDRADAEAWWLAYDTLYSVDKELRDVNLLLQNSGRDVLNARSVKGSESPEILSRTVKTRNWRPVDTRLRVSDVPHIIKNLGGSKLYGDDPTIALRELIQNAADAVQARRKLENRPAEWGNIIVSLIERKEDIWLIVEDNGIGMSEQVLTGPLLDFGTSFWRSSMAMEEFPGLMASGMRAIGRFGVGFFAVFMLGPIVRIYSRRYDRGHNTGHLLEFRSGTSARPILSLAKSVDVPIDGGTRVEIQLVNNPRQLGGLLSVGTYSRRVVPLSKIVGAIAPNLKVALIAIEKDETFFVAHPRDWLQISEIELARRLDPSLNHTEIDKSKVSLLMRPLVTKDGTTLGRALISPERFSFSPKGGWVTIGGLRACRMSNVQGVLLGEAITAARESANPLVPKEVLAQWASEQAQLICNSVDNEEWQAKSAEIVLESGGNIGSLKIVRWGSEWLNADEFEKRIHASNELVIEFEGEFTYDEDRDNVHPKEFRGNFKHNADVVVVFKHRGSILKTGNFSWPSALMRQRESDNSNLAEFVRSRIGKVWGVDFREDKEERVIGMVDFTEITRDVAVFYRFT